MLKNGPQVGNGSRLRVPHRLQALVDADKRMFEVLLYTVRRANTFFRTLRSHGIWITEPDRSIAVEAGRDMNVPCMIFHMHLPNCLLRLAIACWRLCAISVDRLGRLSTFARSTTWDFILWMILLGDLWASTAVT